VAAPASSPLLVSYGGNGGVEALQQDGSRQTVLPASATMASYTPDGTRLTYQFDTRILVADGDGQNARLVSTSSLTRFASQPSLSPDGSHVVFVGEGLHLYVASVDGDDVHQITGSAQRDEFPAWSPDGNVIVFTRRTDVGRPELYRVSPTGGDTQLTFGGVNTYSSSPSWSPDGKRLAFLEETYTGNHLALMNADGSNRQSISPDFPRPFGYAPPAWSPDGTRLAFLEQPTKVDVIGTDRQNWNTLIDSTSQEVARLAWRPLGAGVTLAVDDLDPLIARHAFSVTGTVRSIGLLPATNVTLTATVTNASVARATLGATPCTVSNATAMCNLESIAGDTDLALTMLVAPLRPGPLAVSAHVTAGNDANHTDDAAATDTSVSSCTVLGTPGDDRLRARGGDVVCGLEGNDTIYARNGKADSIDGGPGVDTATVDAIDRVRHVEHVHRAPRAH